jgi:hypothetical protein
MEESIINPIQQTVACPACATQASAGEAFCTTCGYPFEGTEQEQRYFISARDLKAIDLEAAEKQIKRASNALFFIGGLTFVFGFVFYATAAPSEKMAILITNVILAAIYAALGFWCKSKPLTAIISGFSLYVLIIIINAVVSPLTIVSGIIFKIVIIGFFIRGVKAAIEADKLSKELNVN